ncbi:Activator of Hsp90 ATPase 1 family protein [Xylanimonas cellulosilytica DSM 15894]|uniref:Activator of Hsp90 ATPase 1 family protein n=1 Tax=Xylanimonas cellulosilytica (strain DSM 15894 / JCM 12276 / CECT 5975 / KCTC 9989 / LMG 20990 / NBRC 107835 / XIL07) TaxID=446471 RepID=D1BXH5_XYLCX|nr:SRPBCC domain-containing protein [Xylanimonas cellulosilytica]ACZ29785.1 Activator of Hsp90 ATPase 1 family protein [Xylanimonas cellulosilytica DSM 15894]
MTEQAGTLVFEITITAPPERVWEAIVTPEFRARYFFGQRSEVDARVGGRILSWDPETGEPWGDDVVLECDPPRVLAHTWRSLYDPELAAERESRVTWTITPTASPGEGCVLRVVHDRLDASPKTAAHVTGWTTVIDGLKQVVESSTPAIVH